MTSSSLLSLSSWREANLQPMISYEFNGFCPPRCAHNAICINEDLLVWGGYNDENIQTIYCPNNLLWVFNIELDCWFCLRTKGKFPTTRTGAVSVLLWPHWYIIGGNSYDGDICDTIALNLLTLVWDKIDCEPQTLLSRDKSSAWAWNDRIYIFGGYGAWKRSDIWEKEEDHFVLDYFKGWNDQLLYLDCDAKEWIRPECEGPKPSARAAHSSVLVDDVVYVFGGRHCTERLNDLHCFYLKLNTWSGRLTCSGEQPCGRSWHTMTRVPNSSDLLLFGGFSTNNVPLEDAWLLNTETLSWSLLNRKTGLPRLWHTACANSLGDILVFGGCSSNILDDSIRMATSNKVLLFRTKPFKLVRLCLHAIYNHRDKTKEQWNQLPALFDEWLNTKHFIMNSYKAFYSLPNPNVVLGHGPSLTSLSVIL